MIVEYNIENEEGILIQGKGHYCSKLKKGKLKTKKLLKIRWTRAVSTISRASLKLKKYVFTKRWKVAVTAQHLYLKINTGFHARKNPKQQYLKVTISESSHVQWSFIQQKVHLCLRPCSLDNTLTDHPVHEKVLTFRQKLDMFVLGVTHISNLPTVCVKLMQVGGWV